MGGRGSWAWAWERKSLAWLAARLGGTSAVERVQVLATVAVPALGASVPAALLLATHAHARASTRDDVLASRLVLLGLAAGVGAWVLLGGVPLLVTGRAPLSPHLLDAGSAAVALACLAVAAARYRLGEIEPRVRRWLVQALVLVVVCVSTATMTIRTASRISPGTTFVAAFLGYVMTIAVLSFAWLVASPRVVDGGAVLTGAVVAVVVWTTGVARASWVR